MPTEVKSSSTTSVAAAPEPRPEGLACIAPLFAEDTFADRNPDMSFVCRETNPIKGAEKLRVRVVLSGGGAKGVTDGMREWSNIGWYGMAAFGVARTRCCAAPPPLKTPAGLKACKLDESIKALGIAANASDVAAAKRALDAYKRAVFCLARAGSAHQFKQSGLPSGGGLITFKKTLARAQRIGPR